MVVQERLNGMAKSVPAVEAADLFWKVPLPPECIQFVDSPDSEAFSHFSFALENSTMIAMDAEWKPIRISGARPRVSILQVACRLQPNNQRKIWKGVKRQNSRKSGKKQGSLNSSPTQAELASSLGHDKKVHSSTGVKKIQLNGIEVIESDSGGDLDDSHESDMVVSKSRLESRSASDDEAHSSASTEFDQTSGTENSVSDTRGDASGKLNYPLFVSNSKAEELNTAHSLSPTFKAVSRSHNTRKSKSPKHSQMESSRLTCSSGGTDCGPERIPLPIQHRKIDGGKGGATGKDELVQPQAGKSGLEEAEKDLRMWPEMIFILDLLALPLAAYIELLRAVFVDERVLKIGFGFKQDLIVLRGTFPGPEAHGCFDKVEPYLDVRKVYKYLRQENSSFMHRGKRVVAAGGGGLASISEAVLGQPLAKDMQCSNWEQRPLTSEQFAYAAADAYCLLTIVDLLQVEAAKSWFSPIFAGDDEDVLQNKPKVGVAGLLTPADGSLVHGQRNDDLVSICHPNRGNATLMVEAALEEIGFSGLTIHSGDQKRLERQVISTKILGIEVLVQRLGEKLLVSGEQSGPSKRVPRKTRSRRTREAGKNKELQNDEDIQYVGPPPWDSAVGGDGVPKFLCDAMVEGLARQLRCVGIDAASPNSKRCEPRELVELAEREGRIILTRDVKLLRRRLVPADLAYRVKRQGKWEQLAEIIEKFKLSISADQLLSRCTKCNGDFIRKPLTAKEAVAQAPWNQIIPASALETLDTFWACSVCNHIYWQGFQFNRAYEQFVAICQTETEETVDLH